MVSLYVTSMEPGAGKTALCAGLGRRALEVGKRVAYLKPLSRQGAPDRDTLFLHSILRLPGEPPAPLAFDGRAREGWLPRLQALLAPLTPGVDLVLLEGLPDQGPDSLPASLQVLEGTGARALLVARYAPEGSGALIPAAKALGLPLLGVVVNMVPQRLMEKVKATWVPLLKEAGVSVLGLLPEDRALLAVSVEELARSLRGELVDSLPGRGELVENLMIGAMTPDPGLDYYRLRENKAVIARGDRGDHQMAALETSTRCLILTGGGRPHPIILRRAQERGIPIMVVPGDTLATAAQVEEVFGQARFHQEGKLARLAGLLDQHLNWAVLSPVLGLTG